MPRVLAKKRAHDGNRKNTQSIPQEGFVKDGVGGDQGRTEKRETIKT